MSKIYQSNIAKKKSIRFTSESSSFSCLLSRLYLLEIAPVMKSLLMCNLEQLDSDLKTNGSVSDEPINSCYNPTTPFDKLASALF